MVKGAFFLLRAFVVAAALAAVYFAAVFPERGALDARAASLPDFDWRAYAKDMWAAGDSAASLAALEFVIENSLPDTPACAKLYADYLEQLRQRKSFTGRIAAVGKGFLLGDVDGWDALAGAAVADFLLYGDLRDIARESLAGGSRDNFVLAMASVGVATSAAGYAMPASAPLDASVSLLKISKKSGALSAGVRKGVAGAASDFSASALGKVRAGDIAGARRELGLLGEKFSPVWELAKRSKTWSEFSAILRSADSLGELGKLNAVLKSPKNARILERALLANPAQRRAIVDYALDGGDLSKLNAAMRKGSTGMSRALSTAKNASRIFKNADKTLSLFALNLAEIFGPGARWRWGVFAVAALLGTLCALSPRRVWRTVCRYSQNESFARKLSRCVGLFAVIFTAEAAVFWWIGTRSATASAANAAAPQNSSVVWRIDCEIFEDHFWNESRILSAEAPAVRVGSGVFLPVSAQALGLDWREIDKGGVYRLSVMASKGGANPVSVNVGEILLPRSRAGLCLVKIGGGFPAMSNGIAPNPKNIAVFSRKFGMSNSPAEFYFTDDASLAVVCPSAQIGDSAVADGAHYAGMFLKKIDGAFRCFPLPPQEEISAAEKLVLSKPASQTYYTEFCRNVAKFRRDGLIP